MARKDVIGQEAARLASIVGLAKSRSEARRAVANGGLYVNNAVVKEAARAIEEHDLIPDTNLVFLRMGRGDHAIIVLQ